METGSPERRLVRYSSKVKKVVSGTRVVVMEGRGDLILEEELLAHGSDVEA